MSALTTKPFNDVGGTVSTLRRLVAVPLAMVAATVALPLWWDVPLAFLALWWAPADDQWAWVLGVMEGIVGVVWAYVGIDLLAVDPQDSFTVGLP